MSTTDDSPNLDPSRYTSGRERYVRFAEDHLGLELAETQKRILRAAAEHPYLLIQSGNGVGKSFGVAVLNLAFLYSNVDSENQTTSGSYSQLEDTMWRPMKSIWKRTSLPGRTIDSNPPRLEIDDTWYWKAASPRYPDDLEGRHAGEMLMVIEEADKPSINEEHFDSAESNVTDANDRMVAICNPPRGEENIVYQKRQNDKWHVIQFSSFESHNVVNDLEEGDEGYIEGLVSLSKLKENWKDWNSEEWPGLEDARRVSAPRLDDDGRPTFVDDKSLRENPDFRTDLDERWYRRRCGIIPPDGAEAYRPFYVADVDAAVEEIEAPSGRPEPPIGVGVDLARKGGDSTAVTILFETHAELVVWSNSSHPENYSKVREIVDALDHVPQMAVDAVGEGSGVADDLVEAYGSDTVTRFKSGEAPADEQIGGGDGAEEYYNKWTEGLAALSKYLPEIAFKGPHDEVANLREELYAAARAVQYEENRRRSGDLVKATPKDDIKERLGRSPDRLDSSMMAAWAAEGCAPDDRAGEGFLISH